MARKRRLNITVLEELYRELDPFRDRINISAVCEKALEREVARLKAGDLGPRIQAVIERLQEQRGENFQYGYRLGVKYAEEKATFEHFQWLEVNPVSPIDSQESPPEIVEEIVNALDNLATASGGSIGLLTVAAVEEGFREGVLSVWRVVKPYLPPGGEE